MCMAGMAIESRLPIIPLSHAPHKGGGLESRASAASAQCKGAAAVSSVHELEGREQIQRNDRVSHRAPLLQGSRKGESTQPGMGT
jgi:hypothetical protein